MNYTLTASALADTPSDCLVVAVPETGALPESTREADRATGGLISELRDNGDIKGSTATTELYPLRNQGPWKRLLLVGTGKPEELTPVVFARCLVAAASRLAKSSAKTALVGLKDLPVPETDEYWRVQATARSFEDAFYRFVDFKSDKGAQNALDTVTVAASSTDESHHRALETGAAIGDGMNAAKTLGNTPPNICTPIWLAEQAKTLSQDAPHIRTETLDEPAMEDLGMGALLAVSHGSEQPARLILMHYQGADDPNEPPEILVGKGITFDTGGISLKPAAQMDEMKYDMSGASAVFGAMTSVARLRPKANIIGVIAAAENMPGHNATRPGDIVTSMSGQTIEVINTDAEGRMALCDALTYVARYNPANVIDMATLTGACIIALGDQASALMGNDEALVESLLASSQRSGDRAWQLPLWKEYQKLLDSNFADMQNVGGRAAGTITAGCFLSRFAENYSWAHLDIAGTAWLSGTEKGATGRPVPLLVDYLLKRTGTT